MCSIECPRLMTAQIELRRTNDLLLLWTDIGNLDLFADFGMCAPYLHHVVVAFIPLWCMIIYMPLDITLELQGGMLFHFSGLWVQCAYLYSIV